MGYIKEPEGIDLNLSPMPLTDGDKKQISEIIAEYKKTGKVPKIHGRKKKVASRKAKSGVKRETLLQKESKKKGKFEVATSGE